MKSYLLVIIILTAGLLIYLNRAYARIFDSGKNLMPTNIQRSYNLENGRGIKNIKYSALGDSLTYGLGATDYTGTFPFFIAQNLLNDNKSALVHNIAVRGATLEDVFKEQLPQAVQENPDFITLLIGINDVRGFTSADDFKSSYEELVAQLTKTHAKIIIINIPSLGTDSLILPPYRSYFDARTKQFNQIIKAIANSRSLKYVDLYTKTKDKFINNSDLYSADQFHPSRGGYILWGQIINAD